MNELTHLLYSASAMGCITAGLFFLRFWRRSSDRLFLIFALAFWTLALNWIALVAVPVAAERHHFAYGIRLTAFALLLAGIIDKNRRR
jgi:drug/metabolite transporter superfamily protein YnfA